jgi:hypothetical protein
MLVLPCPVPLPGALCVLTSVPRFPTCSVRRQQPGPWLRCHWPVCWRRSLRRPRDGCLSGQPRAAISGDVWTLRLLKTVSLLPAQRNGCHGKRALCLIPHSPRSELGRPCHFTKPLPTITPQVCAISFILAYFYLQETVPVRILRASLNISETETGENTPLKPAILP